MRSIVLGTALALMATSAHAAFVINGGSSVNLPGGTDNPASGNDAYNPDLMANPTGSTPPTPVTDFWTNDTDVITNATSLLWTGAPSTMTFTYLGFEAADQNQFQLQVTTGTSVLFDTNMTSSGQTQSLSTDDLGNLKFITNPGEANEATFDLTSENVALTYIGDNLDNQLGIQIGLNDLGSDGDFDDMVLTNVVPLPGAALLFMSGLAAVGVGARRVRKTATASTSAG